MLEVALLNCEIMEKQLQCWSFEDGAFALFSSPLGGIWQLKCPYLRQQQQQKY